MIGPDELSRALDSGDEAELRRALDIVGGIAAPDDAHEDPVFAELLDVLLADSASTSRALIQWLQDPPARSAAKGLLHVLSVRHLHDAPPTEIALPLTAEPVETARAACRMNSLYVCMPFAFGWVLALLRRWPKSGEAPWLAARDIVHYMHREFPVPLHSMLGQVDVSELESGCAEMLLHYKEALDHEEAALSQYPYLNEFAMSPDEAELVRIISKKTSEEILKVAKKRSLFLSLFPAKQFKYSRSVTIGIGATEAPIEMKLYTGQTHLPMSELTDPLGGVKTRADLWIGGDQ